MRHRPAALAVASLLHSYPEAAAATNAQLAALLQCSPRTARYGVRAAQDAGWLELDYAMNAEAGKVLRRMTLTPAGAEAVIDRG